MNGKRGCRDSGTMNIARTSLSSSSRIVLKPVIGISLVFTLCLSMSGFGATTVPGKTGTTTNATTVKPKTTVPGSKLKPKNPVPGTNTNFRLPTKVTAPAQNGDTTAPTGSSGSVGNVPRVSIPRKDPDQSKPGERKPGESKTDQSTPGLYNSGPDTASQGQPDFGKTDSRPGQRPPKREAGSLPGNSDANDRPPRLRPRDGARSSQPRANRKPKWMDRPPADPLPRPRSAGTLLNGPSGFGGAVLGPRPAQGITQPEDSNDYEPGQLVYMNETLDEAREVEKSLRDLGFNTRSRSTLAGLGLVMTVTRVPADYRVPEALALLERELPGLAIDANHRYQLQAGRSYAKKLMRWPTPDKCNAEVRIGMVDTLVDAESPMLEDVHIHQLEVMPAGVPKAQADHGTAIATIIAGKPAGNFSGLLKQVEVFSADVFRQRPDGVADSTAAWIVAALGKLIESGVSVVNISLGGLPNRLLQMSVARMTEKGVSLVAAAGNGGPDSDAVFPAAYPEVIAVTALDAAKRGYKKANRGDYVDFSAPGVDVFVPDGYQGGRYLSGTSYAVPFISAALAIAARQSPQSYPKVLEQRLIQSSEDLGRGGRDPTFGWGLPDLSGICKASR